MNLEERITKQKANLVKIKYLKNKNGIYVEYPFLKTLKPAQIMQKIKIASISVNNSEKEEIFL